MEYTSAFRTIRKGLGQLARCRKGKKRQAKVCPIEPAGNGFLKYRFLPLAGGGALNRRRERERKILSSLDNLAALYGFTALDISTQPYPYNIHLAFRHAEQQLERVDKTLHLLLLEEEDKVCIATAKEASTGTTLFYIPVYPLWYLLQDRQRKGEAMLLLSVFAYLRQVAGIPYFDDYSPVHGHYEILQEWIAEKEEFTDLAAWAESNAMLNCAFHFGKRMGKQISHPYHLAQFFHRLQSFQPSGAFGNELKNIAKGLYQLYQTYPLRSIMDNVHEGILHPNEEQRIYMEQVVSFTWDEHGWLGEQLVEMACSELNEMSAMDDPVALQFFDTPQSSASHDLQFEKSLFELLHELSDVLRMVN